MARQQQAAAAVGVVMFILGAPLACTGRSNVGEWRPDGAVAGATVRDGSGAEVAAAPCGPEGVTCSALDSSCSFCTEEGLKRVCLCHDMKWMCDTKLVSCGPTVGCGPDMVACVAKVESCYTCAPSGFGRECSCLAPPGTFWSCNEDGTTCFAGRN